MEFFNGTIEEAVTLSKNKNAIFVVFVEGAQSEGAKLTQFINEQKIRAKLQSDDFVVIRVTSDSQAYMQFAAIYQVVPVPSIFFIGKSGKPLEIATEVVKTVDELEEKISSALSMSGKFANAMGAAASSAAATFIAHEQQAAQAAAVSSPAAAAAAPGEVNTVVMADASTPATAAVTKPAVSAPTSDAPAQASETAAVPDIAGDSTGSQVEASATTNDDDNNAMLVSCDGDVCTKTDTAAPASSDVVALQATAATAQAQAEDVRNLLEQKRRERIEEENRLEKERELQRRRDGKKVQSLRDWQKEQELKELRQNILRERQAEKEERERIRAQIAGDRAERAQRNANVAAKDTKAAEEAEQKQKAFNANNPDNTNLLFRLPSGEQQTHLFESSQQLKDVRAFVKNELLQGSGIRDFYLAPSYPRLSFASEDDTRTLCDLGLVPNAVILVIGKESKISPTGIVARSGGILNLLSSLITFLLSPFISAFGFLRRFTLKRTAEPDADAPNAAAESAKRRNIDNLNMGPSTSRAASLGNLSRSASKASQVGGGNSSGSASANDSDNKPYRRYGGANIHRLADASKDSDDENATWNGNSTQQQ